MKIERPELILVAAILVCTAVGAAGQTEVAPDKVWVNYDFVPGSEPLFVEDFSQEQVGNFPRRLTFIKGNMEVAEWQNRRWLRASQRSEFFITLPRTLPEQFTMEFDYFSGANSLPLDIRFSEERSSPTVIFTAHRSGITGGAPRVQAWTRTPNAAELRKNIYHCAVMADGNYVKVYQNELRTGNTPNAPLGRSNQIRIHLPGTSTNPVMISTIRIAAGGKKIYEELLQVGRVATHGILFDTASSNIKPRSIATLKEIGVMMEEHQDLFLEIEGHTDSIGEDTDNQTLSEERAAAVRTYLISKHGIDASRLRAKGYGEAKPIESNDTPEGRATNRRVVLVRIEGSPGIN